MVKNLPADARDAGSFHPWVGQIPWRRKWQPTPLLLPREPHGQRSLADYIQSMRSQSRTQFRAHTHTHTHARSLKINSPFFLKADQIVSCCLQPRVLAHLHFHQVPSAVLLFQPGWLLLLFTPGLAQQGLASFTGNAPLFSHGPACSWLRCLLPHENEPSPYWWLRPGVSPWSLWAPFHS